MMMMMMMMMMIMMMIKPSIHQKNHVLAMANIAYLSKVQERVVAAQTMTANGLLAKFQSAYRRFHSTETAAAGSGTTVLLHFQHLTPLTMQLS